jgi:hypothetical protein
VYFAGAAGEDLPGDRKFQDVVTPQRPRLKDYNDEFRTTMTNLGPTMTNYRPPIVGQTDNSLRLVGEMNEQLRALREHLAVDSFLCVLSNGWPLQSGQLASPLEPHRVHMRTLYTLYAHFM